MAGRGGGGTNQQPSGKSNFPHPRERTRAAALEDTGLEPWDCPRRSAAAGGRECSQCSWKAGGMGKSLETLGRVSGWGWRPAQATGLCSARGGCLGFRNVNCYLGHWNSAKPEGRNSPPRQPRKFGRTTL